MTLEQSFWLFFMLPLVAFLIGAFLWESIKEAIRDAEHNRQRVRELNQQNHELRDEIARLTRQR